MKKSLAIPAACLAAALACAPAGAQRGAADLAAAQSFAEAEPEVDFPACVGIARLEDGAAGAIPVEEGEQWDEAFDLLGRTVGRTVAVLGAESSDPAQVVSDLRAAGAAADVDYVVLYEMAYDPAPASGARAMGRLHAFPMFEGQDPADPARAAGTAVLMDVADGALYGVASAVALDTELESLIAEGQTRRQAAYRAVVTELAHEVQTAFVGMMIRQGLPAPTERDEAASDDLTEADRIAEADREFEASLDAGDATGC